MLNRIKPQNTKKIVDRESDKYGGSGEDAERERIETQY